DSSWPYRASRGVFAFPRNGKQDMVERIVGHLTADFLPGANIEGEVNATVHPAAPFLVGRGPEAGIGAHYTREAVRIPLDLEGECVGSEEGSQDRGTAAAFGARVRRVGGKRRSRRMERYPIR